jgi:hypothetical protein
MNKRIQKIVGLSALMLFLMGAQIDGGNSTAGKANVTTNFQLSVNPPTTDTQAGFCTMTSEVDKGTVTGSRLMRSPETSEDYRLRVGLDTTFWALSFEGATVPQAHIQQNLTTMTATQASGFLALNSANATASGNAANVRTYRAFPMYGSFPMYTEFWLREGNATATNAVSEWGIGYVSGTATPTDGVFFRRLAGGSLRGVINFNGTETIATINTTSVPSRSGVGLDDPGDTSHYVISVASDAVYFWINDVLVAQMMIPANQPTATSSTEQPIFARVYNSGIASAGRRIEIGVLSSSLGDADSSKSWMDIQAGNGASSIQNQPGSASGSTANFVNSTGPASATLSNTAAGYTTLGGQWQYLAVAGAETDYALFGFTIPAGTAALPGKSLCITDVRIGETTVTGAAVVTTTILQWGLATGSTAVSLATADGAATVGPRRKALGSQSLAAAAAIGALAPGFDRNFNTPMCSPPGTFVHVILKQPQGAATALLVFRGTVDVNGYWE